MPYINDMKAESYAQTIDHFMMLKILHENEISIENKPLRHRPHGHGFNYDSTFRFLYYFIEFTNYEVVQVYPHEEVESQADWGISIEALYFPQIAHLYNLQKKHSYLKGEIESITNSFMESFQTPYGDQVDGDFGSDDHWLSHKDPSTLLVTIDYNVSGPPSSCAYILKELIEKYKELEEKYDQILKEVR